MAIARYQDFSIDVTEPRLAGPFWASVLGLDLTFEDDGDGVLRGDVPTKTVWITRVPEPRTVKQRVHIDVNAASVADVEALGATRLSADREFPWTVMADPEGGEFCVFVREQLPAYRVHELVVDCIEPTGIARWWAQVLGGRAVDADGFSYVEAIAGLPFDGLAFVPVPEPKTVKNRVHWDVAAPSLQALRDAGATLLRPQDDEIRWNVMADPEGNEFCAFIS